MRRAVKGAARKFLVRASELQRVQSIGTVLCYHSVHPTLPFARRPEIFAEHLAFLCARASVVSLDDVWRPSQVLSRNNRVALTFDDGYADNYEIVLSELKSASVTATFFVTTGFIEGDEVVMARFRDLRSTVCTAMSWSQLEELRDEGMAIGSHCVSHRNLTNLGKHELDFELRRSRERLEDRLSTAVTSLAYPFGKPNRHINDAVMLAAQRNGYQWAFSTADRRLLPSDNRLKLPRFVVKLDDLASLDQMLEGQLDLVGRAQELLPGPFGRILSPEDSIS